MAGIFGALPSELLSPTTGPQAGFEPATSPLEMEVTAIFTIPKMILGE